MGRSIGSGPATYVSQKRNVQGLVLISPFISLRKVVSDFVGKYMSMAI